MENDRVLETHGLRRLRQANCDSLVNDGTEDVMIGDRADGTVLIGLRSSNHVAVLPPAAARFIADQLYSAANRAEKAAPTAKNALT